MHWIPCWPVCGRRPMLEWNEDRQLYACFLLSDLPIVFYPFGDLFYDTIVDSLVAFRAIDETVVCRLLCRSRSVHAESSWSRPECLNQTRGWLIVSIAQLNLCAPLWLCFIPRKAVLLGIPADPIYQDCRGQNLFSNKRSRLSKWSPAQEWAVVGLWSLSSYYGAGWVWQCISRR